MAINKIYLDAIDATVGILHKENYCCEIMCPIFKEVCEVYGADCKKVGKDCYKCTKCYKCAKYKQYMEEKEYVPCEPVVKSVSGTISTPNGKAETKELQKTRDGFNLRVVCPLGYGDCWWNKDDVETKGMFKCPYCRKKQTTEGLDEIKEVERRKVLNRPARQITASIGNWARTRYTVLRRDGGKCVLCGRGASDGVKLHVDHIKPASIYPELYWDLDNLQTLCEDCNMGKSDGDTVDWRK